MKPSYAATIKWLEDCRAMQEQVVARGIALPWDYEVIAVYKTGIQRCRAEEEDTKTIIDDVKQETRRIAAVPLNREDYMHNLFMEISGLDKIPAWAKKRSRVGRYSTLDFTELLELIFSMSRMWRRLLPHPGLLLFRRQPPSRSVAAAPRLS